ncbi:MAG: hypothetical protein ACPGQL_09535 [Thermoplasmatota archaeon]
MRPFTTAAVAATILMLAVPALAGPLDKGLLLEGLPEGSYIMDDGAIAVPLSAPQPKWLTQEILDATEAAAERGNGYDFERGVEVPLAAQFLYIRPGNMIVSPSICTTAFVLGSPGSYQIASAGHCARKGQSLTVLTAPGILVNIGNVAHSVNGGVGNDWLVANIRSNLQNQVDPQVALIMGPQGPKWDDRACIGTCSVPVKHIGHGLGIGTGGTPRVGVATFANSNVVYFHGSVTPGDSGSGLLSAASLEYPAGQAMGINTHIVIFGNNLSLAAATRMTKVPGNVVGGGIVPLPGI